MKRQWTPEELVEQFTLLPDEMALLETKVGANQLGASRVAQILSAGSPISSHPSGGSSNRRFLPCWATRPLTQAAARIQQSRTDRGSSSHRDSRILRKSESLTYRMLKPLRTGCAKRFWCMTDKSLIWKQSCINGFGN